MIFIPGMMSNRLPSCDPDHNEIIKDERGYVTGWAPIAFWGEPLIFPSLRDMAKDMIKRHASLLEAGLDRSWKMDSIPFYGIVMVQWKPEVKCTAAEHATFKIDKQSFLDGLTKELTPLSKLIPFM